MLVGTFAFANENNVEPSKNSTIIENTITDPFPAYDVSMDLNVDCSASCTFSSCSQTGECGCSCSWFKCTCTSNNKEIEAVVGVSMNKEQYNNTKKFANVLKSLNEKNADQAFSHLSAMVESLKHKDYDSFSKEKTSFLKEIHLISNQGKNKLNKLFEDLGATERV